MFGGPAACGWTKGRPHVCPHVCPHIPPGSTRSGRRRLPPGSVSKASLSHLGASERRGGRTRPQRTAQGRDRRHLLTWLQPPPEQHWAPGAAVQGPDSNTAVQIPWPLPYLPFLEPLHFLEVLPWETGLSLEATEGFLVPFLSLAPVLGAWGADGVVCRTAPSADGAGQQAGSQAAQVSTAVSGSGSERSG